MAADLRKQFIARVSKFVEELAADPTFGGIQVLLDKDDRGKYPSMTVRVRKLDRVKKLVK